MKHRLKFFLLSIFLLPSMASCSTKPLPPVENPNPKHIVKVSGYVSKDLNIRLLANYAVTKEQRSCFPRSAHDYKTLDFLRQYSMEIERNGERYDAILPVDLLQPGECEWRFSHVSAVIVRGDKVNDPSLTSTPLIDSYAYFGDHKVEGQSDCPWPDDSSCPTISNSDNTPVWVRCNTLVYGKPEKAGLNCSVSKVIPKATHLLKPDTQAVEINFYDIERDKDPLTIIEKKSELP